MSEREGDPGYAPGWCIHYRAPKTGSWGSGHEDCEAGVPFASFDGVKFDRRPCFLDKETGESKPGALPCPHLRRPTPEEVAGHEEWLAARRNRLGAVMQGIKPWRDAHKGQSAAEVVECPSCHGRLHLSIAASNGHVHGRCETKGCVSWME